MVRFPNRPLRAIHITGSQAHGYVANYMGEVPWDGPTRSPVATMNVIAEAVLRPAFRRGLPIVAPPEVIRWAMHDGYALAINLRPFRHLPQNGPSRKHEK